MPNLFKKCPSCKFDKCWTKAKKCEECGFDFKLQRKPRTRKIELDDEDIANMNYGCGDYYLIAETYTDFNNKPYNQNTHPLISLADYIEEPTNISLGTKPIRPDHSDLIVELTGKYVAARIITKSAVRIDECVELAEETVKQLKEKKYL